MVNELDLCEFDIALPPYDKPFANVISLKVTDMSFDSILNIGPPSPSILWPLPFIVMLFEISRVSVKGESWLYQ